MKYAFAVALAAASGALAGHPGNYTIVTEVVESYVTYCPEPTEITHGTKTYTVTEPTTLTITDCPCTVTKPVIPTSTVECHDCPQPTHVAPPPAPPAQNTTIPGPKPTGTPVPPPTEEVPPPPTAGAAKLAGLTGIAGLAGLAAFFL